MCVCEKEVVQCKLFVSYFIADLLQCPDSLSARRQIPHCPFEYQKTPTAQTLLTTNRNNKHATIMKNQHL